MDGRDPDFAVRAGAGDPGAGYRYCEDTLNLPMAPGPSGFEVIRSSCPTPGFNGPLNWSPAIPGTSYRSLGPESADRGQRAALGIQYRHPLRRSADLAVEPDAGGVEEAGGLHAQRPADSRWRRGTAAVNLRPAPSPSHSA